MNGTSITITFTSPLSFGADEAQAREQYAGWVKGVVDSYGAHDAVVTVGEPASWTLSGEAQAGS